MKRVYRTIEEQVEKCYPKATKEEKAILVERYREMLKGQPIMEWVPESEKEARKMSVPYNHPDVWIGMDVIAMGWLAIDSTLGKTILTFGVENETPSGKYDESDIFEYEGDKDPIPLKY